MGYSTYKGDITELEEDEIAVVGTNTEGRYGMGFALYCKKKGWLKGTNPRGMNGKTFGIVTKDLTKDKHPSISTHEIAMQIMELYIKASMDGSKKYFIPYKAEGANLNNYTPEEMAGIFVDVEYTGFISNAILGCFPDGNDIIPPNVIFEEGFAELMRELKSKKIK